jgi:hypothetical protein
MFNVELDVVLGFVKEYSLREYGGSVSEIAGFEVLPAVVMVVQVLFDATAYRLHISCLCELASLIQ